MQFEPNKALVEFIRKETMFGPYAFNKSRIRGKLITWAQESNPPKCIELSEKDRATLASMISDAMVHGLPNDEVCILALRTLLGDKAEMAIKRCLLDRETIEENGVRKINRDYRAARLERRRKALDEKN